MDFNGLPVGFAMSLAMDDNAVEEYARLSEAEKEKLMFRCRDAKSKEEMDRIIASMGNKTDISGSADIPDVFSNQNND